MATAIWFFSEGGRQEGPMAVEDLLRRIRLRVGQQVFVWRQGFQDWLPPQAVPELQQALPIAAPAAAPVPAARQATPSPAEAPGAPVDGRPATAVRPRARTGARTIPWFAVSANKLVIMYVVTMGLYGVYWYYQQWKHLQRRSPDERLYPVLGAVFSGISSFLLFPRIRKSAEAHGLSVDWNPGGMALLVLVLSNLWRLPDPVWLLCLLAVVPMVSVQKTVNDLLRREAPFAGRNDEFSALNWVGILLGGLFVLLAVVGSFLPEV